MDNPYKTMRDMKTAFMAHNESPVLCSEYLSRFFNYTPSEIKETIDSWIAERREGETE